MSDQSDSQHCSSTSFFSIPLVRLRVLGLGLFLLTGLFQPLPVVAQSDNALVGDWLGSLSTPVGELRIVFHIRGTGDALQITMDSPDQNAEGIPAAVTTAAADAVRFDVKVASGYFQGALSNDGNALQGTWFQGGASMPLELARQEGMADVAVMSASILESGQITQLAGIWSGTVNAMGTAIPMTYAVDRISDSEVRGRFGVTTQGISDFPFQIAATLGEFTFSVTALGAVFRGRLNDEGNELVGNFNQNGQTFQLWSL